MPVENVWVSGAWRWTQATRVAYYNDLGDGRTLVAVDAHDNEVSIEGKRLERYCSTPIRLMRQLRSTRVAGSFPRAMALTTARGEV